MTWVSSLSIGLKRLTVHENFYVLSINVLGLTYCMRNKPLGHFGHLASIGLDKPVEQSIGLIKLKMLIWTCMCLSRFEYEFDWTRDCRAGKMGY